MSAALAESLHRQPARTLDMSVADHRLAVQSDQQQFAPTISADRASGPIEPTNASPSSRGSRQPTVEDEPENAESDHVAAARISMDGPRMEGHDEGTGADATGHPETLFPTTGARDSDDINAAIGGDTQGEAVNQRPLAVEEVMEDELLYRAAAAHVANVAGNDDPEDSDNSDTETSGSSIRQPAVQREIAPERNGRPVSVPRESGNESSTSSSEAANGLVVPDHGFEDQPVPERAPVPWPSDPSSSSSSSSDSTTDSEQPNLPVPLPDGFSSEGDTSDSDYNDVELAWKYERIRENITLPQFASMSHLYLKNRHSMTNRADREFREFQKAMATRRKTLRHIARREAEKLAMGEDPLLNEDVLARVLSIALAEKYELNTVKIRYVYFLDQEMGLPITVHWLTLDILEMQKP